MGNTRTIKAIAYMIEESRGTIKVLLALLTSVPIPNLLDFFGAMNTKKVNPTIRKCMC